MSTILCHRKYRLPDDAMVELVTSSLSPDGVLTVETPRKVHRDTVGNAYGGEAIVRCKTVCWGVCGVMGRGVFRGERERERERERRGVHAKPCFCESVEICTKGFEGSPMMIGLSY